MFNLIRRDLILQKRQLLIFIPFIIFFIVMNSHPAFIFLVASVFIPFNTYAYDEKAETNILLNSLPYTRKEIIAARYLGALFYMGLAVALTSVTLWIFGKPFTLQDIAIGCGLFLVFVALTFPVFHIFKPGHITSFVLISFILGVGLAPHVMKYLTGYLPQVTGFIAKLSDPALYMGAAALIALLYAVSWVGVTLIYQRKVF